MGRGDRSRSPARTSWISRTILCFGRYPERRPSGLVVDGNGFMSLKSLMDAWARSKQVTEADVLASVQAHMFDEKRGPGHMRFQISADATGAVLIGVNPKRSSEGEEAKGKERRPAEGGWHGWESSWKEEGWQGRDSRGRDSRDSREHWQGRDHWQESSWQRHDDSWQAEGREDSSREWQDRDWRGQERGEASSQPWRQVFLQSRDSAWKARESQGRDRARSWQGRASGGKGSKGKGQQRSSEEAVQRWLAWALASGHRELGISLREKGKAPLAELAAALKAKKPDFGIKDAEGLRTFLAETDFAGRFQEDEEGCLSKVAREQRCPRKTHAHVQSGMPAEASPPRAPVMLRDAEKPPPPPGPDWTQYKDEGTFWWHYDGPLGSFWCTDADKEVVLPMEI